MKIAITSRGPSPEDKVDERFGRAYWILFYDDAADRWEAFENSEGVNAVQGAGIATAQVVAGRGAKVVITGAVGPKAYQALAAAGIEAYQGATGTVADALRAWREGKLPRATAATAAGKPHT
ncbi:NifB/NifX family molybdenum-iron cluster-binding protein [Deferrisoma palaeochoriense]